MRNVLLVNTTKPAHYITNDEKTYTKYVQPTIHILKVVLTFLISGWDHSDARRKCKSGQLLLWHTFLTLRESTARLFLLWASFWFWMGLDDVTCETQNGESLSCWWTNTPLETSVRWFLNQSKERPDTPPPNVGKARMCKVCQKHAYGTCYIANKNTKGKVISKCSKFQIMYMENIDILYAEFSKKWNNDLVIMNQWYDFLFRWYEKPRSTLL